MKAGRAPPKSRHHDREEARAYAQWAAELCGVARTTAAKGLWRAAAVNAIHAAIAAGDAVCVASLGYRSSSHAHTEAAQLLALSGAPDAAKKAEQFRLILALKSRVEYEARPPTHGECELVVQRAGRFVKWALETLPKVKTS